ncbi:type VI secretion system contractile sheath small subunit [Flavilitoribacter nigricans]|uniref:Uncharacterized protein n=1 Tax=Flavilitoribacter nigricans (strain ATCC 23147 / DSM 23189 / NBRC 102662 / NCIMB 1420 / SS-2) TaxID=1122177 RepID=A0A2D0N9Q9_FLAN2|nr:type VI secretion system contractile sheath small subunit [Flavilitoribacter nigricans]PHN05110.1 hypothetical protein CRP01_18995 [Flavilitoribacter nigricans DSM 23189 = NBRC 102662]
MIDLDKVVGAVDVSDAPTGISFNLLNPNNPVFMLHLPDLEDEPFYIHGKDFKTFSAVLEKLNLSFEIDVKTGDEENPYESVTLKFEKMSDFQMSEIIKKVSELKNIQIIKDALQKLVSPERLEANVKLKSLFEEGNETLKEDFVNYLDFFIDELGE